MGMENNMLTKGIVVGAFAGMTLSLFHKETRRSIEKEAGQLKECIQNLIKDPKESINKMNHHLKKLSQDIGAAIDDVTTLKETTPTVIEFLQETRDTFKGIEDGKRG
ncbi:hypothetical protein LC087_17670 [Bacillus carboniphilus]|uniref:YtxH domain-containing protein n=1 Tax=Bacillus carboniphilus TaxID=86663 RepID=A0ABY9JSX6_9BACI|nr:hypothetical protein [Bacillus carboniphilus]WLR42501.1 hypothetical protein LC087_17670 [Bacillus carboniphilus]